MSIPSGVEFLSFDENADSDRPGVVLVHGIEFPHKWDELFWDLMFDQAWEDEWWYGEEDATPFADRYREDVEDEWRAWVREHVTPPAWRWYVWRDIPEGEYGHDEGAQTLEPADEGDEGAFRAALVILR